MEILFFEVLYCLMIVVEFWCIREMLFEFFFFLVLDLLG